MANNEDNQDDEIPSITQKILFAKDLVNYILEQYLLPAIFVSSEQENERIVSIFDDNLKMVADFINNEFGLQTERAYNFIIDNNLNDISWFDNYATTLKGNFFRNASYPESFFHYSVHLAHLAAKLYKQGVKEAPRMVIHYVIEAMDLDLFRSGKEILDLVAKKYAEHQRQRLIKFEQQPHKIDESFVQAIEVQMCIPYEQLSHCKVRAENINEEVYGRGQECEGVEHHVNNKKAVNIVKMVEDLTTISSCPSQSYSGDETNRTFVFDHPNINPYNVLSSSSVNFGVLGSSRGVFKNLYSQGYYIFC